MKNYRRSFIKDRFEVNRNLLHLYESLQDLQRHNYPENIENRIQNFINDLASLIFPKIPSGYDIENDKLYLVYDYEKYIPKSEREEI